MQSRVFYLKVVDSAASHSMEPKGIHIMFASARRGLGPQPNSEQPVEGEQVSIMSLRVYGSRVLRDLLHESSMTHTGAVVYKKTELTLTILNRSDKRCTVKCRKGTCLYQEKSAGSGRSISVIASNEGCYTIELAYPIDRYCRVCSVYTASPSLGVIWGAPLGCLAPSARTRMLQQAGEEAVEAPEQFQLPTPSLPPVPVLPPNETSNASAARADGAAAHASPGPEIYQWTDEDHAAAREVARRVAEHGACLARDDCMALA